MAWSGVGVVVQRWDQRDECDGCSMAVGTQLGSDGDRSEDSEHVKLRMIAKCRAPNGPRHVASINEARKMKVKMSKPIKMIMD